MNPDLARPHSAPRQPLSEMDTIGAATPQAPQIDDDTLLLAFLKLMLPPTGRYCAGIKPKQRGKFRHKFYSTVELLSQGLRDIDRDGDDAYFLPAAIGEELNRTTENVVELKCLRLDVDYGKEGHADAGYGTKEEALRALDRFIMQATLPPPIIILSISVEN